MKNRTYAKRVPTIHPNGVYAAFVSFVCTQKQIIYSKKCVFPVLFVLSASSVVCLSLRIRLQLILQPIQLSDQQCSHVSIVHTKNHESICTFESVNRRSKSYFAVHTFVDDNYRITIFCAVSLIA